MKLRQFFPLFFVALLVHGSIAAEPSASQSIILASTTSVENSGLLAHILPDFTKETGITVHVLAQGTGQALQTAARDDADLVLVHDPEAEDRFIAEGHGIERAQIAWNDFVVVGPQSDPARLAGRHDATAGFRAIAAARAPFVSRGDKSGTDAFEKRLWRDGDRPRRIRCRYVVSGYRWRHGCCAQRAAGMDAYTLSDRGTWLSFRNKGSLVVLIERDPRLINRYDVILLNPEKHPVPKQALARRFAEWLLSPEGQTAIEAYKMDGEQLFRPSATTPK
jgi:tungstate transport system substrate-binding protein